MYEVYRAGTDRRIATATTLRDAQAIARQLRKGGARSVTVVNTATGEKRHAFGGLR